MDLLFFFCNCLFKNILSKKIFFIYRSHSIEYEIRKNNSNFLITILTKIFENYVVNKSDISTAVSKLEQFKFKKYYNCKTFLFPNSLDIMRLKKIKPSKTKKIPGKFIIFSGSYDYQPNRMAINFIINKILPKLKKNNIKLVLTGNHNKKFNNEDVFNFGFVPINKLKYLQKKSICLIVPVFQGYGTRIKILESLIWGNRIISTHKGIEGIEYTNNNNIIICNKLEKMINTIIKFSKSNKIIKYNSRSIKNYSMLENSKKLFEYFKIKNEFKKNN